MDTWTVRNLRPLGVDKRGRFVPPVAADGARACFALGCRVAVRSGGIRAAAECGGY